MATDYESNPPLPDIKILKRHSWNWLEDHLRQVPILGDAKKITDPAKWRRPYQDKGVDIALQNVTLGRLIKNTRPLSLYYLERKLRCMQAVIGQIYYESKGKIDILKLDEEVAALETLDTSLLTYGKGEVVDDGVRLIIPPIIEYSERDNKLVVVDGLHRIFYAIELAGKKVDAYWTKSHIELARDSNIPLSIVNITGVKNREKEGHTPLVPLPVAWERVAPKSETPPTHLKRYFARDHTKIQPKGIPEVYGDDNYYMFRDFGESGGIRQVSAQTKQSPGQ